VEESEDEMTEHRTA